jgi:CheY-like chemotaxis protein
MAAIGAILGVPTSMKSVTCAIDEDLRTKTPAQRPEALGHFPGAADSFPLHVLVVDDEPLIRWSVSETLADLGCDVEQAADAGSALRRVGATTRRFDVVVLDLRLPDMSDLSLLRTLRQLLPGASLILMTAFGATETIRDARALGAAVLNKPFDLDELRRLVSAPGTDTH